MLRNPIWAALTTRHRKLAIGRGLARRYPPAVAPFAAVSDVSEQAKLDLDVSIRAGETVGLLGVVPELGWPVAKQIEILQYVWRPGADSSRDGLVVELGEEHLPAMLKLTALVYPAYFREHTARLGPYFGIWERGRLCAMGGIRMAVPGHQELSAICTHPDFQGRGFGSRVTRHLARLVLDEGDRPFLHTESYNPARTLYERVGFELHNVIRFVILTKPGADGQDA